MNSPQHETPNDQFKLPPVLGPLSAGAIVVGEVIGSGIFLKPQAIAAATGGYVGLILSLWAICGLVNLCGALAMAELSSMYPHAGGNYVFLREAFNRLWAFLWAWAEFWVIRTGSIAALAVAATYPLETLLERAGTPIDPANRRTMQVLLAVGAISFLGIINMAGTRWGGAVQIVMTAVKIASVAFLGILPLVALGHEPPELGPLWPSTVDTSMIAGIGIALASIMWAYDGWGNVTVVAEEIRDPQRNVPRALIGGVLLLVVLYTGANLAYHATLSSAELAKLTLPAVPAAAVAEALLPKVGERLVLGMMMVSLFGALNGNILVGPRVVYAVARDYPRFRRLGYVSRTTQTPVVAIGAVCGWSILLVLLADWSPDKRLPLFDVLTNYCIFGGSIFYLSAVLAVFILRRKQPDVPRPYRCWGYPYAPAVFVIFYVGFLASIFWARPMECSVGLGFIALGALAYRAGHGSPGSAPVK